MTENNTNPYIGPRSYETVDKKLFFGREYETRELCSRIIAHSVVLFYSQSGAGKTSLINAGVIPRLEEEGFDILPVARVSGQIPEELNPKEIKNIYVFNSLLNWSDKQTQTQALTSNSMNAFLKDRKKLNATDAPQLIIFDQFEELITHYQERWTERKTFFEQVVDSLEQNPTLRAVLVMREDYIAYLDPYLSLFPNKLNIRFRLERMRREAAISAIVGPIKETNKNYADDVPEYLVDELLKVRVNTATGETIIIPGEYVEPVQLQVVCQNLWSHLPGNENTITKEYVQTFGSVDDALRGFYDQAVNSVVTSKKIKEKVLRIWFEKQLITLAGTRGTVFRGAEETGGIPNDIIVELQSKHIIRAEWRAGGRWYELTHDSLIKAVQDSNKLFNENLKTIAEQRYIAGLQNFDKQLYTEAIDYFDQAIDLNPDYMLAYAYKSYTLDRLGRTEEALETVNKSIEIDPKYAWAYGQRGKIYNDMKEYHKALADLDKAIELDGNEKSAYANRSLALTETGEFEKALEALNKALEIDPKYAWAYSQRGKIYNDMKEYHKALTDLDKAIELDGNEKSAYANKSYALTETGEFEKALEALNKALEIDPGYGWAYGQRGKVYIDMKEYHKALTDLDKAIELDGNDKSAYANKSYALSETGEFKKALEALNKTLEIDPRYGWAYGQRGKVYNDLKEYHKALTDLDKAIELDGKDKWAYANKSYALTEMGEFEKALEALNKALEIDPRYVWAYNQGGIIYYAMNKYKKAINNFNEVLKIDPNFYKAYGNRGDALLKLGKESQAKSDFENVIRICKKQLMEDPENSSLYSDLAWYSYVTGDYMQAVEAGEKAISFNPDLIFPYFNLGLAYLSLGKDDKAIKTYKSGMSKAKNLPSDELEKKLEDAKKDIEDLVTRIPERKETGKNIITQIINRIRL
ncbi:MAG: tetratricopeptide repeat protein [Candidatus Scalindua sp.]|nr:tetratricopeptide repeat protein [Candidatus Scalindua sp.]